MLLWSWKCPLFVIDFIITIWVVAMKCPNDPCVTGTFHKFSTTFPCAILNWKTFILNKLAHVDGVILQPLNDNLWKL